MKISIITVVLNNARTIEDTIQSVAAQNYSEVEHIVVDGGSTDGTLAILEKHRDKLAAVISESDQGIYYAMNKGLKLVTGDVVGLLNADDVYAGDDVLKRVSQVFADPSVDVCYADLVYVHPDDLSRVIRYWKSCEYRHELYESGWMPPHPTFFVRHRAYKMAGDFDTEFSIQADFEFMFRLLWRYRVKSVYVPHVLVKMRFGGTSNRLRNILKGNIEAWRACRKNGLMIGPFFIIRKILSRIPQFFRRPERGS